MATSLKDKVVLITGASSGFGMDAARLFARQGCRVVLAARRLDRLQALAASIQEQGGEALAVPVDVSRREEIDVMVSTVLDFYGQIDILFNNAGFGRLDWHEMLDPVRDIQTQIEVNLLGVIHTTHAVLPHMINRGQGTIINMASVAGWIAAPLYTIYAASKFGVRGFTDALRREAGYLGIRVCGIYPGPAQTEFSGNASGNALDNLKWKKLFYLSSEQVARRVVALARRPRRAVIIPWWFRLIFGFEALFPGLVDWFLKVAFVRRYH